MKQVGKGISIIYSTYRENPQFQWFADSLAYQIRQDELEVIVVDGNPNQQREQYFHQTVDKRFPLQYVGAMPSCYSGTHRLTKRDLFTPASARNTGAIYAKYPYLVFADDQSLLMPSWWATVKKASKARRIIAGAYQKVEYFEVQSGQLTKPNELVVSSYDCRWSQGSSAGAIKISGDQLYGCSFGIPKEYFLEVNGFDEICDPIGMEDAHLGMRLDWAGHEILYDRAMLTIELNNPKQADRYATPEQEHISRERINPPVDQLAYFKKLAQFGVYRRFFVDKPFDASWMVLDLLYGIRTSQTLHNPYQLADLKPENINQLPKRFSPTYWFNDQALEDL